MKIEIYCEGYERGTAFEVANALINNYIGNDYGRFEDKLVMLDEISDHIKVFVNHAGKEVKA